MFKNFNVVALEFASIRNRPSTLLLSISSSQAPWKILGHNLFIILICSKVLVPFLKCYALGKEQGILKYFKFL